jgi:hypothetical protein
MKRRLLLSASTRLALGGALSFKLLGARAQPSYKVSAAQLEQAVAQRFPRRYPVAGLLDMEAQAPHLRFMPEQNRLGAEMAMQVAGPALRRAYAGSFDVDFALRYEASDLSIRASQLRVNALRFDDLAPGPSQLLSAYGPALAEQTLQDAVLHTLKPQDLALPDGMGLQPGSITVTANGLVIGFVAKPLR